MHAREDLAAEVFPTHVGMNRLRTHGWLICNRIPHTRGDEPASWHAATVPCVVFPTHVGMNRLGAPERITGAVFPTHVGMNRGTTQRAENSHVFPTHVGMNRNGEHSNRSKNQYSPHTWG